MDVQLQTQGVNRTEIPRQETTRPEVTREPQVQASQAAAVYTPSTNSLLASIVESNGRVVNDFVTDAQLDTAVSQINEFLQASGRHLEHRVHEDTNTIMVRVINTYSGEVIRELPDEDRLDALFTIKEALGLNINASV